MKKLLFVTIFAALALPLFVSAAEVRTAPDSGNVSIAKHEKTKNLYTFGTNVTTENEVTGDLTAAGSNLNINGSIQQSLMAAGANINIRGNIGQNAKIVGGTVSIDSSIKQDALIAGGTIILSTGSSVGGDLWLAGGTIEINGKIAGEVKIGGAETVIVRGEIEGDLLLYSIDTLKIEDKASVGGKLTYSSPKTAIISDTAKIAGGIDYKKISGRSYQDFYGLKIASSIMAFLMGLVTLLVIIYVFPKTSKKFITLAYDKPWAKLGWGVVVLIVSPIVFFVLMATIIGVQVGFLALIPYIYLVMVSYALSGLLIGSLIWKYTQKTKEYVTDWKTALIGIVVVTIISLIPVFGGIIKFIFFLIGFGTLAIMVKTGVKAERAK